MTTLDLDHLAKTYSNDGHSIMGPSSSAMWLECPGSLIPNILQPDDGNPDSAYGTVAHSVTEAWLTLGRKPVHMLGTKHFVPAGDWGYLIEADDEMFGYAKECVDRCSTLPGKHLIETRVDFSHLTPIPNQGGTLDFAAINGDTAYVIDHKFGSSPENIVRAEANSQLMLYAIGLREKYPELNYFVIRINQPRLNHFDEWACSGEELSVFANYVAQQSNLAWRLDAPRKAGIKQCRWCRVKGTCGTNAEFQDNLYGSVFEDVSTEPLQARLDAGTYTMQFRSPKDLTTAQMARLRPYRAMAESWWKSLDEELESRALNGEQVPGYKLVESRTKRKWASQAKAEKCLIAFGAKREDIVKEKLISPAQAEKVLIEAGVAKADLPEALASVVIKPAGKPTLVPLDDRRDAWMDPSSVAFGDTQDESLETEEL